MSYIERKLLDEGFAEVKTAAKDQVVCAWGPLVRAHVCVWIWWWAFHNAMDTWLLWRAKRRVAIRMPLFWLWGATLHFDPKTDGGPDR